MVTTFKKKIFASIVVTQLFLMGCSTHVVVTSEHPTALIKELPYKIGLVLDNSFTNYSFIREKDDEKITISLGKSQSELFNKIFNSMFQYVSEFSTKPLSLRKPLDLYVSVVVEDLQLSLPRETSVNIFEIWIKYKLEIFDSKGSSIHEWIISSYGRTQTRFLDSQERALHQATNSALRDAGVQIVTDFHQIPEILNWINEKKALKNEG
jgi:hypothetical protein